MACPLICLVLVAAAQADPNGEGGDVSALKLCLLTSLGNCSLGPFQMFANPRALPTHRFWRKEICTITKAVSVIRLSGRVVYHGSHFCNSRNHRLIVNRCAPFLPILQNSPDNVPNTLAIQRIVSNRAYVSGKRLLDWQFHDSIGKSDGEHGYILFNTKAHPPSAGLN